MNNEPSPKDKTETQTPSVLSNEDKREITMSIRTTKTDVMDPVAYEQMKVI